MQDPSCRDVLRSRGPELLKPRRLQPGDHVAVLSPSWGGPARFPKTFEAGLRTLEALGLRVREYPSTRDRAASVAERVRDLHDAFGDPQIRAIVASIGGDDAVRLLPHLDPELMRMDPKVVMGYSDTTALLCFLYQHGVISFHGPSVMAGLAQAAAFPPAFVDGLKQLLFAAPERFAYEPFGLACHGYLDWSGHADTPAPLQPDAGPRVLQGSGRQRGVLWGGCLEVLEMVKGTPWWPPPPSWQDTIVILEGSEEVPPPESYCRALRSWAVAGNLERVSALLVGRAPGYTPEADRDLDDAIQTTISGDASRPDLLVMTNCDFGHTDPQWVLPIGARCEIDADRGRIVLIESPVS